MKEHTQKIDKLNCLIIKSQLLVIKRYWFSQFSSVIQSCLTLCNPMDCSTPGLPVHHQLPEFTQTDVHWVGDAIQPTHPLSSPCLPTFNLSQHQGLFQWVSSLHQVAEVLEFQLQQQSFQRIFRTDFLWDGLAESPCRPRDSQESSPTPQFKSINSSVLSFLYSPILTSIHDYWKNWTIAGILPRAHLKLPMIVKHRELTIGTRLCTFVRGG